MMIKDVLIKIIYLFTNDDMILTPLNFSISCGNIQVLYIRTQSKLLRFMAVGYVINEIIHLFSDLRISTILTVVLSPQEAAVIIRKFKIFPKPIVAMFSDIIRYCCHCLPGIIMHNYCANNGSRLYLQLYIIINE